MVARWSGRERAGGGFDEEKEMEWERDTTVV